MTRKEARGTQTSLGRAHNFAITACVTREMATATREDCAVNFVIGSSGMSGKSPGPAGGVTLFSGGLEGLFAVRNTSSDTSLDLHELQHEHMLEGNQRFVTAVVRSMDRQLDAMQAQLGTVTRQQLCSLSNTADREVTLQGSEQSRENLALALGEMKQEFHRMKRVLDKRSVLPCPRVLLTLHSRSAHELEKAENERKRLAIERETSARTVAVLTQENLVSAFLFARAPFVLSSQ